jgi:hypothetical protein
MYLRNDLIGQIVQYALLEVLIGDLLRIYR